MIAANFVSGHRAACDAVVGPVDDKPRKGCASTVDMNI